MKLLRNSNAWTYDPLNVVDSFLNSWAADRNRTEPYNEAASSTFRMDTFSDDNSYHLIAELPGYKKENIDVRLEKNRLIIEAKKEVVGENESKKSSVKREVQLGNGIDTNQITASMENGILKLKLPKKAEEATKVINVN